MYVGLSVVVDKVILKTRSLWCTALLWLFAPALPDPGWSPLAKKKAQTIPPGTSLLSHETHLIAPKVEPLLQRTGFQFGEEKARKKRPLYWRQKTAPSCTRQNRSNHIKTSDQRFVSHHILTLPTYLRPRHDACMVRHITTVSIKNSRRQKGPDKSSNS